MHRIIRIIIDIALIVAFAVAGRASHQESLDLDGITRTAAPFVGAALLFWIFSILTNRAMPKLKEGVAIWATVLVMGMLFRIMVGDGVQIAFILVAAATLALFLIGWRAVWWLATRERRSSGTKDPRRDAARSGNPAVRDEARRKP